MTESSGLLVPFGAPTTTVAETPHPGVTYVCPVLAIISPTPTMVSKMHPNHTPTNCAVVYIPRIQVVVDVFLSVHILEDSKHELLFV